MVELPGFKEMEEEELYKIGQGLRKHKMLAKGANVNFFSFNQNGDLYARTFERGVEDFTLACGTGAGSLGFTLLKKGILKGGVARVNMPGGVLTINLEGNNEGYEDIIISGPTNIVAEGIILDEELA